MSTLLCSVEQATNGPSKCLIVRWPTMLVCLRVSQFYHGKSCILGSPSVPGKLEWLITLSVCLDRSNLQRSFIQHLKPKILMYLGATMFYWWLAKTLRLRPRIDFQLCQLQFPGFGSFICHSEPHFSHLIALLRINWENACKVLGTGPGTL